MYALVSTLVWAILVTSSFLAHYCAAPHIPPESVNRARSLSVFLRRLGKTLAALNAFWIVAICVLQFGSFFSRCFCSSSVLELGWRKAFASFVFTDHDLAVLWSAWRVAAAVSPASCFVFLLYIFMYINPPVPE